MQVQFFLEVYSSFPFHSVWNLKMTNVVIKSDENIMTEKLGKINNHIKLKPKFN